MSIFDQLNTARVDNMAGAIDEENLTTKPWSTWTSDAESKSGSNEQPDQYAESYNPPDTELEAAITRVRKIRLENLMTQEDIDYFVYAYELLKSRIDELSEKSSNILDPEGNLKQEFIKYVSMALGPLTTLGMAIQDVLFRYGLYESTAFDQEFTSITNKILLINVLMNVVFFSIYLNKREIKQKMEELKHHLSNLDLKLASTQLQRLHRLRTELKHTYARELTPVISPSMNEE